MPTQRVLGSVGRIVAIIGCGLFIIWILMAIIFVLVFSDRLFHYVYINNSNRAVVITVSNSTFHIPANESVTVSFVNQMPRSFRVEIGEITMDFNSISFGAKHIRSRNATFQIENNGNVYLLPSTVDYRSTTPRTIDSSCTVLAPK